MDAKTCMQCGELKPMIAYRSYYGGRKGTYTRCKDCERVNAREKYLTGKGANRSDAEERELDKIHSLYEAQMAQGFRPPRCTGGKKTVEDSVDAMLDRYSQLPTLPMDVISPAPQELSKWLSVPLDRDPDYYLDTVYEKLRDAYMPIIRIDNQTMMPVYDTTYKHVLDRILERFNMYEDNFYEEDN